MPSWLRELFSGNHKGGRRLKGLKLSQAVRPVSQVKPQIRLPNPQSRKGGQQGSKGGQQSRKGGQQGKGGTPKPQGKGGTPKPQGKGGTPKPQGKGGTPKPQGKGGTPRSGSGLGDAAALAAIRATPGGTTYYPGGTSAYPGGTSAYPGDSSRGSSYDNNDNVNRTGNPPPGRTGNPPPGGSGNRSGRTGNRSGRTSNPPPGGSGNRSGRTGNRSGRTGNPPPGGSGNRSGRTGNRPPGGTQKGAPVKRAIFQVTKPLTVGNTKELVSIAGPMDGKVKTLIKTKGGGNMNAQTRKMYGGAAAAPVTQLILQTKKGLLVSNITAIEKIVGPTDKKITLLKAKGGGGYMNAQTRKMHGGAAAAPVTQLILQTKKGLLVSNITAIEKIVGPTDKKITLLKAKGGGGYMTAQTRKMHGGAAAAPPVSPVPGRRLVKTAKPLTMAMLDSLQKDKTLIKSSITVDPATITAVTKATSAAPPAAAAVSPVPGRRLVKTAKPLTMAMLDSLQKDKTLIKGGITVDPATITAVSKATGAPPAAAAVSPVPGRRLVKTAKPLTMAMLDSLQKDKTLIKGGITVDPATITAVSKATGAPPAGKGGPSAGKGAPPAGKGAPPAGKGAPPAGKGAPPAGKGAPPAGKGGPPGGKGGPPAGPVGYTRSAVNFQNPLNMTKLRKMRNSTVLKKSGVTLDPQTNAAVRKATGVSNGPPAGRNGDSRKGEGRGREGKNREGKNREGKNREGKNREGRGREGRMAGEYRGESSDVFDWNSFAKAGVPMEVPPSSFEVSGTEVGSVSAEASRGLDDGTDVKYSDAPIKGADGKSVTLWRIPAGSKISVQEMVARLKKAEKVDNILEGSAGYQEVLSDLNDAIRDLTREIADWTEMRDKYSGAIREGKISPAQIDQLKGLLPLLNSGIAKRNKELADLNAQKVIVDTAILQIG